MSARAEDFLEQSGFQFTDTPEIKAVALDIDGTQLREDIKPEQYAPAYMTVVNSLKEELNSAAKYDGLVVVHATNRMFHLYKKDEHLLAEGQYATCAASTEVYSRNEAGIMVPDADFDKLIAESGYDVNEYKAQAAKFPELIYHGKDHETERKVSYHFDLDVPVERRFEIFEQLQDMQTNDGVKVFIVEDGDHHIIDFLPAPCNKASVIEFIADKENIALHHWLGVGNSNNDEAMVLDERFNGAAVGDARPSLKDKVLAAPGFSNNGTRRIVADGSSTQGVRDALHKFGVTNLNLAA